VAPSSTVHGTAVRIGARGVLIRGASGSGKSSLALALIDRDPAANVLVSDDHVALSAEAGRLVASALPAIAGLLEVRGIGLLRVPHVASAAIDLVVDLHTLAECPRLPDEAEATVSLAGIAVPRIFIAIGLPDAAPRVRAALTLERQR
jgi:HPr kinase/phosphorylase